MKMRQLKGFIVLLIASSLGLQAQESLDSIAYSLKQKPTVYGKLGTRNSFIDNYRAQILGVQVGLNYNNCIRMGIGYHQLYSSANSFDKPVYLNDNTNDVVNAHLRLWYGSISGEYIYHNKNSWKFSIPFLFGLGQGYYQYSYNNGSGKINNSLIFVYEPAVSVEYKFIKWAGIGTDIGFRFLVTNYKHFDQKLNAPTYAFKLFIDYSTLYQTLVRKKTKSR